MGWLDRIVHSFIMTFGITQPSPQQKRAANVFIGLLLLAVVIGFLGVIGVGLRYLVR